MEAAERLGEPLGEGDALTNLGMALWHVRNFEKTIAAYQSAVAIFHAGGPRHREARVLTNLGNAQRGLGRFEEAIISHEDAAAIFRQTGDRHGLGDALTNLGVALRHASKFEEAITALQERCRSIPGNRRPAQGGDGADQPRRGASGRPHRAGRHSTPRTLSQFSGKPATGTAKASRS